jgi:hypothetical protein
MTSRRVWAFIILVMIGVAAGAWITGLYDSAEHIPYGMGAGGMAVILLTLMSVCCHEKCWKGQRNHEQGAEYHPAV